MTVRAIKVIREIRDRNSERSRHMSFEERQDFIRRKTAETSNRLKDLANVLKAAKKEE